MKLTELLMSPPPPASFVLGEHRVTAEPEVIPGIHPTMNPPNSEVARSRRPGL
jgi:hypothetical protein